MAHRSFRERFFTPPVARAVVSPAGLVLAAAGVVVGLVVFSSVAAAIGLAIVGWAARVLGAVPRRPPRERIDPFTVSEQWRRPLQDALQARTRFHAAVQSARRGPLRERLEEIASSVDRGVDEAWQIAKQGQRLVEARKRIDTDEARRELTDAEERAAADEPAATVEEVAASLRSELAAAERLDRTITETRDRLRLTNARLDQAVAQAAELSVAADDVAALRGLGEAVDALVLDLQALRHGLEEVQRPGTA